MRKYKLDGSFILQNKSNYMLLQQTPDRTYNVFRLSQCKILILKLCFTKRMERLIKSLFTFLYISRLFFKSLIKYLFLTFSNDAKTNGNGMCMCILCINLINWKNCKQFSYTRQLKWPKSYWNGFVDWLAV